MSRPQFQAKAITLGDLATAFLAYDCTAPELFEACERLWPWLSQPDWSRHGIGHRSLHAWGKLRRAYIAWECAGRPADLPRVTGPLRYELADAVIDDWKYLQIRKRRGSRRATPNRAGWRELDITYSCGCSGGLAWMRVDAHGNLRDEEVAILAAKEYYHQC